MKKYEKPSLSALSISSNDMLCGSCSDQEADILIYNNPSLQSVFQVLDGTMGNKNGKLEASDFSNAFGSGEDCVTELEGYCKFSGANTIFWS